MLAYADRSQTINYAALSGLTLLGEYRRRLPVSMARMMENAYDWEHLPYIHASTFQSIERIDDGPWGWRAHLVLSDQSSDRFAEHARAAGAGEPAVRKSQRQDIELLVDRPNGYWATTVLSGVGVGLQIHTRATKLAEREIEIAVRFYVPPKYSRQLKLLGGLKRLLPFALYRSIASAAGLGQVERAATPAESLYALLEGQYALLYDEDLG